MPAPASATLSPCHGLQHADITVSNIVSSECSQIRHNLGDKDWYRGHEVIFRHCCWKGQHLKLSSYQLQRSDSYTRTAWGWGVIAAGAIAQKIAIKGKFWEIQRRVIRGSAVLFCRAQHYVCVLYSCPLVTSWSAIPPARCSSCFWPR